MLDRFDELLVEHSSWRAGAGNEFGEKLVKEKPLQFVSKNLTEVAGQIKTRLDSAKKPYDINLFSGESLKICLPEKKRFTRLKEKLERAIQGVKRKSWI